MATPQAALLVINGLSVEFPGVKALEQVDFTLQRGEWWRFLGKTARASPR
ncbi:Uncharacterised protein [Serratia fonticola]|uniref:Uncharacterized protein n=1 Tax=Serratia fonticola TaxID=47917 RepID=A0A4U9WPY7_SERFO|nr:Uncharacterised protein [Serratia fonticola]